ncbi:MFS transporter [Oceanidesulfovibrio marinus]|uniref:MFS transporter n=1 Tax=Oceanidesulfovibrio marinus TaxID=370038 RepID=A0A6P1ZFN3_9BACT|nr:MFS transporter [Oceanidesulfovibrio marinus]QJT09394.1 MFS transporter [Oceanidesulfovibrio marinus]TVM33622.1 MFS transporter [Oceanidesulfovibrio marinus]
MTDQQEQIDTAGPSQEQGTEAAPADKGPSAALVVVFAIAIGSLVANLYIAQPIISSIAPALGITPDMAGLVVSVTQVGYGLGLFLLVSLADLVENRALVFITLGGAVAGLFVAATATSAPLFFAASFLVGISSTGAQVLLPYIVQLAPMERRGRVVGNVMAGLLSGVMLARPASLFVAGAFGWRAVFWGSGGLMLVVGLVLTRAMPRYMPQGGVSYGRILLTMLRLVRDNASLRRRSVYQGLLFCAFNIFWTTVPILLGEQFGMGEYGIGLFALAGAGGALAAPMAGRLADKGYSRSATFWSLLLLGLAFLGMGWAGAARIMLVMVLLTVLLDAAVQTNQIVSQRIIFSVPAEIRGRANAIYMTMFFAGGALGSVLGTIFYHHYGWAGVTWAGCGISALTLLLFATERRSG